MDAKEKKDRADQTARRVYDILKNHDQEMSTIEAQIDAERAALEEDLEAIRARAYPRGVRYDTPRVQSSPDPDGLLVKVADAIQRRTARTKRATDALEERQRQIENVHEAILTMDAKSKIILLTLYGGVWGRSVRRHPGSRKRPTDGPEGRGRGRWKGWWPE